MKFINLCGTGLAIAGSIFVLSNNVAAATINNASNDTTVSVEASASTAPTASITKPSQADLRSAITRVEAIENYHAYSLLSASELAATTEFYREYAYLFDLVAFAHSLDQNYANASAEDLQNVIDASKDAEIACGYLFGTVRKNSTVSQVPSSSNQPESSTTLATSTPAPTTPVAVATTITPVPETQSKDSSDQNSKVSNPEATSSEENTSSEKTATEDTPASIPNTGAATEKDNQPFFITLGIVVVACLLIGGMIILNRKKSYRPGRKF